MSKNGQKPTETDDEYQRFEDLARKLVKVPKSEIDARRKADAEAAKR